LQALAETGKNFIYQAPPRAKIAER